MVASIAASAFFPHPPSSAASAKASKTIGEGPMNLDVRGIVAKPTSSSTAMPEKVKAQAIPKINGTKAGLKSETQKADEDATPSSSPRRLYNQLPDWSVLLAAVTTIFLAAEKQWTLLDWKPRHSDMLADAFSLGKIVQDGLIFRQNFSIRSYEIGANRTGSIEMLMNHLQVSRTRAQCVLIDHMEEQWVRLLSARDSRLQPQLLLSSARRSRSSS